MFQCAFVVLRWFPCFLFGVLEVLEVLVCWCCMFVCFLSDFFLFLESYGGGFKSCFLLSYSVVMFLIYR